MTRSARAPDAWRGEGANRLVRHQPACGEVALALTLYYGLKRGVWLVNADAGLAALS
jgi:hypothetical protein